MAIVYLTVPYREKDAAKALGARWDGERRQWFVPEGRELAPFLGWMPEATPAEGALKRLPDVANAPAAPLPISVPLPHPLPALTTVATTDLALTSPRGMSLSRLLAAVSTAVAQSFGDSVWTLVEVMELRSNGGHVYLGVSERDGQGKVLAKTMAVIWSSTAQCILPAFEIATGVQLAAGIKLLVKVRPAFNPLHAFSLEVQAIDSQFTLGDLEAKKREIRARLRAAGVFGANKALPAPFDFVEVLVIAPEGGAGLGDFEKEAGRLHALGLCRFRYAFSHFQGEGAARSITATLVSALRGIGDKLPDAVVIIRGGGAANDLAWLNDHDLARALCDSPVPVFTGIGHERDHTVLDEVAHTRFDTPSKVIAGIEQVIVQRALQAKADFADVQHRARRTVQACSAEARELHTAVQARATQQLARGKALTGAALSAMERAATERVRHSARQIDSGVQRQLLLARTRTVTAIQDIAHSGRQVQRTARAQVRAWTQDIFTDASRPLGRARQGSHDLLNDVAVSAGQALRVQARQAEALMREVMGQGPQKTLGRGFAIVRESQSGHTVTRAEQLQPQDVLAVEFQDDQVLVVVQAKASIADEAPPSPTANAPADPPNPSIDPKE